MELLPIHLIQIRRMSVLLSSVPVTQKIHLPFALFIAFAILLAACEKNESVQERKVYYSNGVLKEITTYRDSVKNGKYVSFYENGNVKEKGFYKLGQKDGVWKEWYDNGLLKMIRIYKLGSAKFVWVKWNENGKIKGMGDDFYL